MEIKAGDTLEEIVLTSIDGSEFNIASVKGKKVLLTFYRFAKWPICNLRINEFVKIRDEFGENFMMVGICDSELVNLQKAMMQYFPLPIKGHFGIRPVDIFVNLEGVVEQVQYGKEIADHFSFVEVKSFSE